MVFSSSITRDIKKQNISNDCKRGSALFHEFKGKKARDIVRYMNVHLEDTHPHSVVLVAGGNDLPEKHFLKANKLSQVPDYLIDAGCRCKSEHGVTDVYISSILPRSEPKFQVNRHRVNNILRERCKEYGFIFIENDDIILSKHVLSDGVHLNDSGSLLLHHNLLAALNT